MPVNPASPDFTGDATFSVLGGSLDWSIPLIHRHMRGLSLTPRLRLSTLDGEAPDGRIANEDARLNFLSSNTMWRPAYRGPYDRIETGTRLDAGLTLNHFGAAWDSQVFTGLRTLEDQSTRHGLISTYFDHSRTGLS